jgi:hypothetical protein
MPFVNQLTLAFTAMSVRKNAPAQSGVYGLSCAREWIYVGHADNIQDSLLRHLMDALNNGADAQPTGFTFELCSLEGRVARQDHLVRELEPVRNRGLNSLFDTGGSSYRGTQQERPGARRGPVPPLGPPRRKAL